MSYLFTREWGGMGATTQQYVATGQAIGTSAAALASATGVLAPIAAGLGVSVPVLGAIIGGGIMAAGMAIDAIMNSGCGQTCITTTSFANQANAALQQNIEAYFKLPVPRPRSAQITALGIFDQFWNWLQSQCGQPALGNAGVRCITDRQAGACTWKQPASSVPPWGSPPAGSCWNWFSGYRDPIANDPNVYDDSADLQTAAAGTVAQASGGIILPAGSSPASTSSMLPWLMMAGAAGVLWAVS